MTARQQALIKSLTSWKGRLYFLRQLPSLWFWGVRIQEISRKEAKVFIPFRWRSQNPFRSVYFAAQAGAAELSTGVLALVAIENPKRVSMLVTGVEGSFSRKATSNIVFTCADGEAIFSAVERALETGEGQSLWVETIGHNTQGEEVSRFRVHWSFKARK